MLFWGPLNGIVMVFSRGDSVTTPIKMALRKLAPYISKRMPGKNIIYSNNNNIMSNRNELVRRLLSGISVSELQNLFNIREEARLIPAPRGIGRASAPPPCSKKKDSSSYTKDKCPTINTVF